MRSNEFCANDVSPIVPECPDCVDKVIKFAKGYCAERDELRKALRELADACDSIPVDEFAPAYYKGPPSWTQLLNRYFEAHSKAMELTNGY